MHHEQASYTNYIKVLSLVLDSDADPTDGKAESFSDGEVKDKKCSICSQIFTTESQLQKHLRQHELNDKVSTALMTH